MTSKTDLLRLVQRLINEKVMTKQGPCVSSLFAFHETFVRKLAIMDGIVA